MSRRDMPEPWMFGVEVSVNGEPMQPQIRHFTLLGRLRIAWRTFRGQPPFRMINEGTDADA